MRNVALMKRTKSGLCMLAAAVFFLVLATLSGCATDKSGSVTSEEDEYSAVEEATITTRTVTFPSIYFEENESEEEVVAELTEAGYSDIVPNEDGSYTVTMNISQYNELVEELYTDVKAAIDSVVEDENYPSIVGVEYNDDFSQITLTASGTSLPFEESFVTWGVGVFASMYQQIAGVEVKSEITVIGSDGVLIESTTWPDDLEDSGSGEIAAE